jgi:hypothetical protein
VFFLSQYSASAGQSAPLRLAPWFKVAAISAALAKDVAEILWRLNSNDMKN